MILGALRPPQIVDQISPECMSDIHAAFPEQSTGTEWYRDPQLPNPKPELLEALLPLNRILLSELCEGQEPWAIYYQVDTRSTLPQRSQRGIGWHIDGGGSGTSVIVANALPTELLVAGSSPLDYLKNYALVRKSRGLATMLDSAKCEQFIENGTSAVYTPKPYELAVLRGHIHRSPTNTTDQPIARCWIRAAIHPKSIEPATRGL